MSKRARLSVYLAERLIEDFKNESVSLSSQEENAYIKRLVEECDELIYSIQCSRNMLRWGEVEEESRSSYASFEDAGQRWGRRIAGFLLWTGDFTTLARANAKRTAESLRSRLSRKKNPVLDPAQLQMAKCTLERVSIDLEIHLMSLDQYHVRGKVILACRALVGNKSPGVLLYLFTRPPGSISLAALDWQNSRLLPNSNSHCWQALFGLKALASLARNTSFDNDGGAAIESTSKQIMRIIPLIRILDNDDTKLGIMSKKEKKTISVIRSIAKSAGAQDLKEDDLRSLASMFEGSSEDVSKNQTFRKIWHVSHNLLRWNVLHLLSNTRRGQPCLRCSRLEYDSSPVVVRTCIEELSTGGSDAKTIPGYLCNIGAFIYQHTTAVTSRGVRSEDWGDMDPTVAIGVQLKLANLANPWNGLTRLLQVEGISDDDFTYCDISSNTLDLAALPGSPASHKIQKRVLSPISSRETLSIIQSWITNCNTGHDECSRWAHEDTNGLTKTPPCLPTRVVDLGVKNKSTPRLIISAGLRAEYVALSYCWGKSPTFTTTLNTLSQRMREIRSRELPAVFVDAFAIARLLGIRYVWIDALCIVQDDEGDWEVEARKMGSIYQSAHVTIAATRSSCVAESFLPEDEQDRPSQHTLAVPYKLNTPESGNMALVSGLPNPTKHLKEARLNSRGWVLQERLLSRRILHFARDQIYWECRETVQAEDGSSFPLNDLGQEFLFPLPGLMKKLSIKTLDDYNTERDKIFQNAWLSILAFYCNRDFTKASDRMVALSSLVNKLRPLTRRTYVDGNWFLSGTQTVPPFLLWRPADSHRSPDRSIPSWSWASRTGKLDFAFHNRGQDIHVTLLGLQEANGDIPPALHLRGHSFAARVQPPVGNISRSCDLFELDSDENGKEVDIGNVYFDDLDTVQPGRVECLYLFDDSMGYPVYWAMRAVSSRPEAPLYIRIGVATQARRFRSKLVERDVLLV